MGYDNSLDVMGIHRMGGMLATGLFASKAVNAAGVEELFFENAAQFAVQPLW
ncbi:MAG: hypothetical protein EWM72_03057 [Nitrospira sp.]|nr:MAG: hypothetical protein EWM72_03057 [Nitrospira sp.]